MGSFDPDSQFGSCFELLKTGALYKSESNKAGGDLSAITSLLTA